MPSPSKQFWQNLQNDVFYGCVIKSRYIRVMLNLSLPFHFVLQFCLNPLMLNRLLSMNTLLTFNILDSIIQFVLLS